MNEASQSRKGFLAMLYALSYFGSMGLIVLVRDRPGFRLLRGGLGAAVLIPIALAFLLPHLASPPQLPGMGFPFAPVAAPPPVAPPSTPLLIYALLVFLVGAWKQAQEWGALNRGESWHTRTIGLTYLYRVPILNKFRPLLEENRLQRIIDPLLWLCVSLCVLCFFSKVFGYWLVFSSFMLFMMEETIYQKQLNDVLDAYDGQTEAGVIRRGLKMFSGEGAERQGAATSSDPLHDVNDSGIPTGVGRYLKDVIEQRRQRNEKRAGVESETGSTMSGAAV
jgi:hypothetical protein